jgi:hypothetical protein
MNVSYIDTVLASVDEGCHLHWLSGVILLKVNSQDAGRPWDRIV